MNTSTETEIVTYCPTCQSFADTGCSHGVKYLVCTDTECHECYDEDGFVLVDDEDRVQ